MPNVCLIMGGREVVQRSEFSCLHKQAGTSLPNHAHIFDQDGSLIFHKHGLQAMLTSGRGREKGPAGGLAVAVGQLRPVVKGEDLSGNGTAFICVGRHGFKQLLVEPKVFEGEQKKKELVLLTRFVEIPSAI